MVFADLQLVERNQDLYKVIYRAKTNHFSTELGKPCKVNIQSEPYRFHDLKSYAVVSVNSNLWVYSDFPHVGCLCPHIVQSGNPIVTHLIYRCGMGLSLLPRMIQQFLSADLSVVGSLSRDEWNLYRERIYSERQSLLLKWSARHTIPDLKKIMSAFGVQIPSCITTKPEYVKLLLAAVDNELNFRLSLIFS